MGSNTILEPKIKGATQQRNFTSNIGTPQGDSLSPVLFTIYLEEALKEVRKVLPQETKPCEVAYADDVYFVDNKSFANIDLIDPIMTKQKPQTKQGQNRAHKNSKGRGKIR